jgi:hypothetical protein
MIAGLAAQVLPSIAQLSVREDVQATITRFGLDPSKPADVTAAYAFLWAEDHGPWVFDTPQTGPAMLAMAERAIRAAQADPDLFGRAIAGDADAQKAFSAAVAPPAPGSAIETRSDEERSRVAQMTALGTNGLEIQATLDHLRATGKAPTAEERRNTPAIVRASTPLPHFDGPWLLVTIHTADGAKVPGQIAEKLLRKKFSTFRELREALWKTVANTLELVSQFTEANQRLIRRGYAPYAPNPEAGQRAGVWELHHDPQIGQNGPVYDLSTIRIPTPGQHDFIHFGKK